MVNLLEPGLLYNAYVSPLFFFLIMMSKYRNMLLIIIGALVYINKLGIYLTGRPLSVLLSFRCAIETLTTVPFLVSNFMEYGQFLYGKS